MRRAVLLWAVLFAAYAATLGLHAQDGSRFTTAEAHQLLVAESIVSDHDVDLNDEYTSHAYRDFYPRRLTRTAGLTNGRLVEPTGVGLGLLIAPAYELGGPTGVELFCAALVALGFVFAAGLARALVPDPWATGAALVGGLSPATLAAATTVGPELVGGALLAGAALMALRVRAAPRPRDAFAAAALVAVLPWLALKLALPAAVVALALAHWLRRRRRGLAGFVALEVVLTSAVVYLTVNDRLYGGFTPYAVAGRGSPTGLHDTHDAVARAPRLLGVLLDREAGVLRWAPFGALALYSVWLLVRSLRDRLAYAVPEQSEVEVAAILLVLVCGATGALAIVAGPALHGPWATDPDLLPALPCGAALCAWGLRRAPRAGAALAALTLTGGAWLLLGARLDASAGLAPPHGALPWGGAEQALPRFAHGGSPGELAVWALAAAALAALAWTDQRRRRCEAATAESTVFGGGGHG